MLHPVYIYQLLYHVFFIRPLAWGLFENRGITEFFRKQPLVRFLLLTTPNTPRIV